MKKCEYCDNMGSVFFFGEFLVVIIIVVFKIDVGFEEMILIL